ncbi:MAG: hypothetical protein K0U64_03010 [Actinomycetia bacterium]|nr:hypothetical protein [Actinomycetes bacterium]
MRRGGPAVLALGALLALAGCTGTESATSDPSTAGSAVSPTSPNETATGEPTSTGELPQPPSGSKELENTSNGAVQYAKYSNQEMTPGQVVQSYEKNAETAGYTVTDSGGSGGGWGDYGGGAYGMTAKKPGSYLSVQATGYSAGESNRNTNFEVCLGPDKSALTQCD